MSDIDDWIAKYGLDATIDCLIRTCGYDRARASIDAAPKRFETRGERMHGIVPGRVGAPKKRAERFREVLFNVIDAKRRAGLNDKDACHQFAGEVAALRRKLERHGALDQLALLGLEEIADLNEETLLREWKRIKPRVMSVADAGPEIVRQSARKILKTKAKAVTVEPPRRGQK